MIQTEEEYRYSQESLLKMYRLLERMESETLWPSSGKEDAVLGVKMQISKIEKEIAVFLEKEERYTKTVALVQ
jgi:hypothetical protein